MRFFDLFIKLQEMDPEKKVQSTENPDCQLKPLKDEELRSVARDDIPDELWLKTQGFVPSKD